MPTEFQQACGATLQLTFGLGVAGDFQGHLWFFKVPFVTIHFQQSCFKHFLLIAENGGCLTVGAEDFEKGSAGG